ncbi:serine hydrolase domain-containing protein [Catenuloplanes atrovinosus]|uniref:CubicO group peptidase (Beta-lactamase class C family) n=1 Tax=Catenuloplanes atrovinosus TaxID=137266 RepID=A0AAE3YMV1_9ACTN|nr:serine hydrolase domain-containing protein [Catenuloplanes atrovinosus]MDR7275094.1 CubicO group peptidase (beta-lactamase class C family) [Catenuloplanes atrovinosus]
MTSIEGTVAPGYERVAEAFAANLALEAGAAVAVYRHGEPVVDLWGGVADPGTGRPWRRDTLQVVYSTTKALPSACACLLAERGVLDLDAPVAAYWPEFAAGGKDRIPVRWLLTHQAGLSALPRMPLADLYAWHPVIERLAAAVPEWEPGTAIGYHALTFGWLVGEVIRRADGRTPGRFFADEIAAPLGLDLHIGLPPSELDRRARVITAPGEREALARLDPAALATRTLVISDEPLDLDAPDALTCELPSVNGVGTARALARFYAALIGEVDGVRVLAPETLRAATSEQAAGPDVVMGVPSRVGLGFGLPSPEVPWYSPSAFGFPGHGGSLGYADPETGIAFGYLMNRLHADYARPDPRAANLIRAVRAAVSPAGR